LGARRSARGPPAAGGGYEYDAYSPGDDVDVAPAAAMAPSAEEVEEKE
jgi:hypothetical protein